jgi:hypothetical protein
MDLELIRTLTFCKAKNLVNADSQTYCARYLGMSLSFCFSPGQKALLVFSKCVKIEDSVRLRVQYLLDTVVNQLNIHVYIVKCDIRTFDQFYHFIFTVCDWSPCVTTLHIELPIVNNVHHSEPIRDEFPIMEASIIWNRFTNASF